MGRPILIVEDDPADLALTLRALQDQHARKDIVITRDGAEALDYLFGAGQYAGRQVHDLPYVVFLDLNLPKIDGMGILARIRAEELTKILPVVILSSSDLQADMVQAYRLGANSYVRKPVDYDMFASVVKRLADYWLSINRSPV